MKLLKTAALLCCFFSPLWLAAQADLPAEPIKPNTPIVDKLTNNGTDSLSLSAGYVVCGYFLLCIIWSLIVLIRERLFKRRMDAYGLEQAHEHRRRSNLSEKMSSEEMSEWHRRFSATIVNAKIFERQTEAETERIFRDYGDVISVSEQLEWGWRIGLTDPEAMSQWQELYAIWHQSMERHYLFWESGNFGKSVLIGGAVIALILCYKCPPLGIMIGIPFALYSIAGRTPLCVAVNPGWLDGALNWLTRIGAGTAVAVLPAILSFEETRYYRVSDGSFHHSDVTPTGIGPLVIAIFLAVASFMLVFVRIGLMFLRNYVIYRDMRAHHQAWSWILAVVSFVLAWWGFVEYGCWELWFCEFSLVAIALLLWAGSAIFQHIGRVKRIKVITGFKLDLIGWTLLAALAFVLLLPIKSLVAEADARDKYVKEMKQYKTAKENIERNARMAQEREERRKEQEIKDAQRRQREQEEAAARAERERQYREEREAKRKAQAQARDAKRQQKAEEREARRQQKEQEREAKRQQQLQERETRNSKSKSHRYNKSPEQHIQKGLDK